MNAPCQSPESRRVFDDETLQKIARGICGRCPVLEPCRESVLSQEAAGHPVHGVAGGLLPSERPHAVRMEADRAGRPKKPVTKREHPGGRPLAPCGTRAAYRRHERYGESPCDACADARRVERRGHPRIDERAVTNVANGHRMHLNPTERRLVISELTAAGLSASEIAVRIGVHRRTVVRGRSVGAQAVDDGTDSVGELQHENSIRTEVA